METHPPEVLSQAEVLSLIRSKIDRIVLYPQVSEQIQGLKRTKALKGAVNPENEYPTVSHADLIHVIRKGSIVHYSPLFPPQTGWTANIEGVGCDGWQLIVTVEVSKGDDPLAITSFLNVQP